MTNNPEGRPVELPPARPQRFLIRMTHLIICGQTGISAKVRSLTWGRSLGEALTKWNNRHRDAIDVQHEILAGPAPKVSKRINHYGLDRRGIGKPRGVFQSTVKERLALYRGRAA